MKKSENTILYETLTKMRSFQARLMESENGEGGENANSSTDAIPYTSNDDILAKMTNEAKSIFGADFSKSKTPMMYFPKDNDVTLTGEIPGLENAKFQFKLNSNSDGSGIILWVDSLPLSDGAISVLSKLNGAGKNWKKELNEIGRQDLKPVSARDDDSGMEPLSEMVNGDDLPSLDNGDMQDGDDFDDYYDEEHVDSPEYVVESFINGNISYVKQRLREMTACEIIEMLDYASECGYEQKLRKFIKGEGF